LAEPVKTKLCDRAIGARFVLTAARVPLANGFCKQLIGTMRQKRRNFLIPRTEQHLLRLLRDCLATTGTLFRQMDMGIWREEAESEMAALH
jgi:hypothetical protein